VAWTYGGDPSQSDLDMVRWLVGDTDITDQLVRDEEVQAALDRYGSPERAGAKIARAIAANFSRLFDKTAGDVKKAMSQKAENFRKLADELDATLASATAVSRKAVQQSNIYVW